MVRQLLLTVVVLTALIFAPKVTALECYDCYSYDASFCCTGTSTSKTCGGEFCIVSERYVKYEKDDDFRIEKIFRGCDEHGLLQLPYNGTCYDYNEGKILFKECTTACSSDLCNSWETRECNGYPEGNSRIKN